jgi:tetratricopeptide (TPR) repeat protein
MAERLMYLPGLGFNLAAAVAACAGMESARFRKAAAWLTVALAAGYAARTWDRNFDWRDHYALFHSALRTSPDSALVQANYAAILLHERNDPAAAIPHARRALEIQPADPPALFTLGEASLRTGDLARAAEALEKVVSLAPRTSGGVDALRRLGPAYERMGRREDAASAYRRLLEWRPGDARAKEALGRLAAYAGPAR